MYVWNHIDVSDFVLTEIKQYYANDYYLQKQVQKIIYEQDNGFIKLKTEDVLEKCKEFANWIVINGIEIDYIGYLISAPFFTLQHCHIDTDISGVGINFPVSGRGEDTETIFYEPNNEVRTHHLDRHNDKTRTICYSDNWKVLTRYNLTKPTICINTIPHKFTNYGEGIRISMTVRSTPETIPFKLMKGWDTGKDTIRWNHETWYEDWYGYKENEPPTFG